MGLNHFLTSTLRLLTPTFRSQDVSWFCRSLVGETSQLDCIVTIFPFHQITETSSFICAATSAYASGDISATGDRNVLSQYCVLVI